MLSIPWPEDTSRRQHLARKHVGKEAFDQAASKQAMGRTGLLLTKSTKKQKFAEQTGHEGREGAEGTAMRRTRAREKQFTGVYRRTVGDRYVTQGRARGGAETKPLRGGVSSALSVTS